MLQRHKELLLFKNNSIVFGVCVFFILLLCAMLNTNVVMNTQIFNVKYNRKRRHIPLSWHVFNKLAFPLLKMEQKRSEILIRLIKKMHAVTVPFSYARQTSWKSIRIFFSVFIYGSFLFLYFLIPEGEFHLLLYNCFSFTPARIIWCIQRREGEANKFEFNMRSAQHPSKRIFNNENMVNMANVSVRLMKSNVPFN